MLREDSEVDPQTVPGRSKRVGTSLLNAHRLLPSGLGLYAECSLGATLLKRASLSQRQGKMRRAQQSGAWAENDMDLKAAHERCKTPLVGEGGHEGAPL